MNGNKEYSGLAIADYFIRNCLNANMPITNMAVLKMIYFAHGLAYAKLNRKLIKDPFYAWEWGPVEQHTYTQFKKYGANPIQAVSGKCDGDLTDITQDTGLKSFLDELLPLAEMSPFALSQKSHEPGGPWAVTTPYKAIDDKIIEVFFTARYGRR